MTVMVHPLTLVIYSEEWFTLKPHTARGSFTQNLITAGTK